jgi:MFS family permease
MSGPSPSAPPGLPPVFKRLAWALAPARLGMFVFPFVAYYLARGLHLGTGEIALVIGALGIGWTIGTPAGGFLADRVGRRTVIVWSNLGAALAYIGLDYARSAAALCAAALAMGLAYDCWRPASQALLDAAATGDAQRKRVQAWLFWFMNAGAIASSFGAGLIAWRVGWSWLFLGNAMGAAVFAVAARILLPADRVLPAGRQGHARPALRLLLFTGLTLLCMTAYSQSSYALPVRFAGNGISPLGYGLIAAVNPLTVVLVLLLVQRWVDRIPAVQAAAAGMLAIGCGIGLTGWGSGLAWFVGVGVIWVLGEVLLFGPGAALVASMAPPGSEGSYLGIWGSTLGLSTLTASAAGAALIHLGGLRLLWLACGAVGVVTAGLCLILARTGTAQRPDPAAVPASPEPALATAAPSSWASAETSPGIAATLMGGEPR